MKVIKGLTLLSFLLIFTGSCFDAPEFPVVPQIEFDRVEFRAAPSPGDFDSLDLYIRFKDGNGDLGLSKSSEDMSDPFQSTFFYQESNGEIEPLIIEPVISSENNQPYDLLHIPDPENGKLVFFRTRKNSAYNFLPQNFHCVSYRTLADKYKQGESSDGTRLVIGREALDALDPLVQLVDSFPKENPAFYQIKDTLYYTPNANHNNIEVDWLIKDPTAPGGFREYNWMEEFCVAGFDGRFPVFSDNQSSIDGTLRYSMASLGLKLIFSIKTLKLRVSIKDRALNVSNVIETPEFTLLQ